MRVYKPHERTRGVVVTQVGHVFGERKAKDYRRLTCDVNSKATLQGAEYTLACAFALIPTEETSYVVGS